MNSKNITYGAFVISIDFEMMWGSTCIGQNVVDGFKYRIQHINEIIDRLLREFEKYSIHATWAVVGAIACSSKQDVLERMDYDLVYDSWGCDIKEYISQIKKSELDQYFGRRFLVKIVQTKHQFIGSHTFSHFYVDEKPDDNVLLEKELLNSRRALQPYSDNVISVVFPKNQVKHNMLDTLKKNGFEVYRGVQKLKRCNGDSFFCRLVKFMDAYFPLCGKCEYDFDEIFEDGISNVRASRIYRTFFSKLSLLEPLKTIRIKSEMTHAAKSKKVYHLWFHPHNFGSDVDKSFKSFEKILKHYQYLHERYGFQSLSMEECADLVRKM